MNVYKIAKELSRQKQNVRYILRKYPNLSPNELTMVLYLSWYLNAKRNGRKAEYYFTWMFEDMRF